VDCHVQGIFFFSRWRGVGTGLLVFIALKIFFYVSAVFVERLDGTGHLGY
jgi:hypothetical protein